VARGVAEAMVAGVAAVAADPERALDVAAEQVPGLDQGEARTAARATLDATLAIMLTPDGRADGSIDTATWQAMGDFMAEAGLLAGPPDVSAAIAPEVLAA
jgi:ABC-type nitrate/sulfonate/bicarbonate transport system substrate-binding protein